MKKLITVITVILLLAACGTKGSNNEEGTNQLERIQEANKLVVGVEGAFPPFNYFDSDDELVGFDVDISKEIGERLGVEIEFAPTPWDTIIGGLTSKKYDVIISSVAPTEERKAKVDFTEPYYTTGVQIFTNPESDIKGPEDLKGKSVGVVTGTTFAEEAEKLGASTVFYDSDLLTFQDLSNERIDAIVTDRTVGLDIVKKQDYPFVTVGELLYEETPGITLNKNESELKEKLNEAIKEMKEDGTYEKISLEWFDENIE